MMLDTIKNILDAFLKPTPRKIIIVLGLAIMIPLLDWAGSYCTEDMCFNGVYRIAGPDINNYFFVAHVLMFIFLMLLFYIMVSLLYGFAKYLVLKSQKKR